MVIRLFTIVNLARHPLGIYTPNMRRISDTEDRPEGVVFGIDTPPAIHARRGSRLPCKPAEALVYVGDMSIPIKAEIHDVSRWGLRLVLAQHIAAGSAIKMETAGVVELGEIRYCIQTPDGSFNAGMRIDPPNKMA